MKLLQEDLNSDLESIQPDIELIKSKTLKILTKDFLNNHKSQINPGKTHKTQLEKLVTRYCDYICDLKSIPAISIWADNAGILRAQLLHFILNTVPDIIAQPGKSDLLAQYDVVELMKGNSSTVFEVPDCVKRIGRNAFRSCPCPETVKFSSNVNRVCICAFLDSTVKNIIIPEDSNLEVIEADAFANTMLQKINLPLSLKSIGSNAFYDSKITSITIPKSVEIVDNLAFSDCTKLQEVIIDANCEFGSNCFYRCENLNRVYINGIPHFIDPGRVFNLDSRGLYNLQEIHFKGSQEQWEKLGLTVPKACQIYCNNKLIKD